MAVVEDHVDNWGLFLIMILMIILYILRTYPKNYWLQVFWMVAYPMLCVVAIANSTLNGAEYFFMILALFNELICIFYISANYYEKKK